MIIFLTERGGAGAGLAEDVRSGQERAAKNRLLAGVIGRDLETGEDQTGNIQHIDNKIYRSFLKQGCRVSRRIGTVGEL